MRRYLLRAIYWLLFPRQIRNAVEYASLKAAKDAFTTYPGSSLGREIRRDEASEWTKLTLKDAGYKWRDSDINLACELYFHGWLRNN